MLPDCSVQEVSLMDALVNAHQYKGLAGEMEAQNIAVLRLLIAITHTVFTRVDLQGNEDAVEDTASAMKRWKALMQNGFLPEEPIRKYFSDWHERFWLIHPKNPFYQVPRAKIGTKNTAAKLNGEVSESNHKARLFSCLSGTGRQGMTFSEGARWLLFLNGFDDCAAKQIDSDSGSRSMTIAWLGKLGLVMAVGSNLYETILLNMPMLQEDGSIWSEDDQPVWELDYPCDEERRTIPMPRDLASLYTLQSRRILLITEGDKVTGYKILGGDAFSEQNALSEPMTLWRFVEDKKTKASYYRPKLHERSRQIWRDFGALVNVEEDRKRPGVVSWCTKLKIEGVLPYDHLITFRIVSVRYDSNMYSSITDSFSDSLSFHSNLLTDAGTEWIRAVNREIQLVNNVAVEVGNLAANLVKACAQCEEKCRERKKECGQREDHFCASVKAAKEQFYLSVDLPFRDWLLKMDSEQDSDERNQLINEWQETAKRIALCFGRQLVDEKGEVAFIGRTVTEKESKKEQKKRHYSSPEAYNWFRSRLSDIYPNEKEGNEQNG